MRKGTGSLQISPRRLLSLLLLHIIAALAVQQVNGSRYPSSNAPASNAKWIVDNLAEDARYTKQHMMMSRCTSRYVQVKPGKLINARGNHWSPYAVLNFISAPNGPGQVRIQGETSKTFLCFSRRGRLIARRHGESLQCVFKEKYKEGTSFVSLQSAVNDNWFVGFNARGRKFFGFEFRTPRKRKSRRRRRQKHEECFLFTKISSNSRLWRRRRQRSRRHFNESNLAILRRRTSKHLNR